MKNLKRITKLGPDFPIKPATLRTWFHFDKYPGLLFKVGGALVIDLNIFDNMAMPKGHIVKRTVGPVDQAAA